MDAHTLNSAYEIIRQPLGQILPRLSAVLAPLIPHRAAAELATHCAHSPYKTVGESGLPTAAELTPLLASGTPGSPWQGRTAVGGQEHEVVAVTSDATARRSVLVLVREDGAEPVPDGALAAAQALWDLVTSHFDRFAVEAMPGALARSRAAADTRARVIAELTTAHSAALSGILGVLRSRALDDGAARTTATDLAVNALIEMQAESKRDRSVAEEPAREAFDRLADGLKTMLRHSTVRLELGPPDSSRSLAADVAHGARAVVRALLLVILEQDSVSRVRVGWQITEHELRATLRDDGDGALAACDLGAGSVTDRLEVLGGRLEMDAVPGWGTTITATLPLATPDAPIAAVNPLTGLGGRELEVLTHLALGHRNRQIAQELHISESTVKFHVANILTKLGVDTRGEAAALYHRAA
ncbi:LuxR C-terminal-related transcriptional regulator [Streptomyces sp. NPDC046332]|uniref:LuxR C-terminal-related transcriptional regulator n=1 Tax=Streptomyces sp. NPDC046332 TaxID=3155133 RepID=UPI0033DCEAAE